MTRSTTKDFFASDEAACVLARLIKKRPYGFLFAADFLHGDDAEECLGCFDVLGCGGLQWCRRYVRHVVICAEISGEEGH